MPFNVHLKDPRHRYSASKTGEQFVRGNPESMLFLLCYLIMYVKQKNQIKLIKQSHSIGIYFVRVASSRR